MWKICKAFKAVRAGKAACWCPRPNVAHGSDTNENELENQASPLQLCGVSMPQKPSTAQFSFKLPNTGHFGNSQNANFPELKQLILDTATAAVYFKNIRVTPQKSCVVGKGTKSAVQHAEVATQTVGQQSTISFDSFRDNELSWAYHDMVGLFRNSVALDMLNKGLYAEAFQQFKQAAELNKHPTAIYNYGMCYYKGYGVKRSTNKAMCLWKSAADLGHPAAQYQVAIGHLKGLGTLPVCKQTALRYAKSASECGKLDIATQLYTAMTTARIES